MTKQMPDTMFFRMYFEQDVDIPMSVQKLSHEDLVEAFRATNTTLVVQDLIRRPMDGRHA